MSHVPNSSRAGGWPVGRGGLAFPIPKDEEGERETERKMSAWDQRLRVGAVSYPQSLMGLQSVAGAI